MFRQIQRLNNYFPLCNFHIATLSSYISQITGAVNSVSSSTKFHIFSAICIERTPSFISGFSSVETCFNQYSDERLINLSRLSDYEVDKMQVQLLSSQINHKIKSGKLSQKELLRLQVYKADIDFSQHLISKEFSTFCTLPLKNDQHDANSLSCNPDITDHPLYLLARPIKGFEYWVFPQRLTCSNQSLKQSAYFEISENIRLSVKILSDFPDSFYTFGTEGVCDSHDQDEFTKIFFFKANLTKDDFASDVCQYSEIRWCTRSQVKELVAPKYFLAIENMLYN